ncbi:MAG: pilus assembly protein PilN [Desulfobacterales bacterium CG23_combo_of_CG06-09_8_20_14_all_51_8]|nr:MAG: pilus assembly protein PilN [Desulfobacterales bacterium CG23_combo_of_CG06-09_8_20_14_all_51_8]
MIRINLLPYRAARSKENIRKQISIFLLSFVLFIVLLGVFNIYLNSQKNKLSDNLDQLKKEVALYEAQARQVEEIKKKLDTLNKQIEVVNQLKDYREKPPKLLAKMTEMVVPGRMQLTRLTSDDASLALQGMALDNETVAVFMLRLERSALFSAVNLTSSQQVNKYNVDMKQFLITCIKMPAAASVGPPKTAETPK